MKDERIRRRLWRLTAADRFLHSGPVRSSRRYTRRTALTEALQRSTCPARVAPRPLPEVAADGLDYEAFLEVSDGLRRSVVVRGLNPGARAVTRWDADYLRRHIGEETFTFVGGTPDPSRPERDTSWDAERTTFAAFLERLPDEAIYLNNDSSFAHRCPQLLEDLDLACVRTRLNDPRSDWDELISTQLFVSSSRAYSPLHAAQSGNFFLQIRGRKTWTLVEPAYSLEVYPILARPALYAVSHYGGWREVAPDHALYRIPRYEVTLEPGDVLYNAPWWWHEVTNDGPLCIGCAFRHMPRPFRPSPSWGTQPQLTALSTYSIGRTLSFLHWSLQRTFGMERSLRDFMNPVLGDRVHRSQ